MTSFPLFIYSLDREIYEGEANSLTVPGSTGQLQILANHTPLIALLEEGDCTIERDGKPTKVIPIASGVLKIHEEEVVVLVNF